jgi:hypothetical protein
MNSRQLPPKRTKSAPTHIEKFSAVVGPSWFPSRHERDFKTAALNLARPPLRGDREISQHSRAALPPASPRRTSLQMDCKAPTPARTVTNLTEAEPRPHAASPRCDGWWASRNDPLFTILTVCEAVPVERIVARSNDPAARKPDPAPLRAAPALQRDRAAGTLAPLHWTPDGAPAPCPVGRRDAPGTPAAPSRRQLESVAPRATDTAPCPVYGKRLPLEMAACRIATGRLHDSPEKSPVRHLELSRERAKSRAAG